MTVNGANILAWDTIKHVAFDADFDRTSQGFVATFYGRDAWAVVVGKQLYPFKGNTGVINHEIARIYFLHKLRLNLATLEAAEDWLVHALGNRTPNDTLAWMDTHGLIIHAVTDLQIIEWIPRSIVSIENQVAFEAALKAYREAK